MSPAAEHLTPSSSEARRRAGLSQVKPILDRVAASNLSPAGKRKALLKFGIKAEYVPHQGAKERAKALKRFQRAGG